jgi:predicted NodU family carbamoyl transferase
MKNQSVYEEGFNSQGDTLTLDDKIRKVKKENKERSKEKKKDYSTFYGTIIELKRVELDALKERSFKLSKNQLIDNLIYFYNNILSEVEKKKIQSLHLQQIKEELQNIHKQIKEGVAQ